MQGNPFGVFFAQAAQKVGAATKHDGFDSSVIQVLQRSTLPFSASA